MLLAIIPAQLKATGIKNSTAVTASKTDNSVSTETTAVMERMKEYKAMDKSTLTQPQRRHYRNEYRSDRSYMRSHNTVYIGGGGVLLVIVLLVIFL